MPSHIDTGSKADKAAAKQGRKFMGRIYNTVAQKVEAQKTKQSYNKPASPTNLLVKTGISAKGWKVRDVAVFETGWPSSDAGTLHTKRIKLLGACSVGSDTVTSALQQVEVMGVRLEVNIPIGVTRIQAAFAIVANDAVDGKSVVDVAKVPGSLKLSSVDVIDGWYTLALAGLATIRVDGQTADPVLLLYGAMQATGSGSVAVHVHVTYRTPEGGVASHIL